MEKESESAHERERARKPKRKPIKRSRKMTKEVEKQTLTGSNETNKAEKKFIIKIGLVALAYQSHQHKHS